MKRKRDALTRARERESARRLRQRRQARARQTGWLISELSELSGQSPRTIRYYLQRGVLSPPTFRGTATRYGRGHLLRLLAIQRLKQEGVRELSEIQQRLDAAGEAQLLAAVAARPPSAAVAAALGLTTSTAVSATSTTSTASAPGVAGVTRVPAPGNTAPVPGEPWRRMQLLPGLELLLAESASAAVRQLALQLQAHCVGASVGTMLVSGAGNGTAAEG